MWPEMIKQFCTYLLAKSNEETTRIEAVGISYI